MTSNPDRPRGVLTPADRKFLRGESELKSKQSRRDARLRIRNRIENAILDFSILFEELEERDLVNVFSSDSVEEKDAFQDGIVDALAFLYWGSKRAALYPTFESMLIEGVKAAEAKENDGDYQFVEVEFEVKNRGGMTPEQVLEKLQSDGINDVSDGELRAFVQYLSERGVLDSTDIIEEVQGDTSETS